MKPKAYLAGPIANCSFEEAEDWRSKVRGELYGEIDCFSPLRGKAVLMDAGVLDSEAYPEYGPLCTQRGILARDYNDCRTADLVLANLLWTNRVSIGTVMEIAFAHAHRVPVLVVAADGLDGTPHDHPMLRECADWIVDNLDEAIWTARRVLLP